MIYSRIVPMLSGEVRESFWVQLDGVALWPCLEVSSVKAAPEQLRRRTSEEKEANRVVVRDILTAAEVLRDKGAAKNFEAITDQDWPDGEVESDLDEVMTETTSVTVTERPVVRRRRAFRIELPVIESEKNNEHGHSSETTSFVKTTCQQVTSECCTKTS